MSWEYDDDDEPTGNNKKKGEEGNQEGEGEYDEEYDDYYEEEGTESKVDEGAGGSSYNEEPSLELDGDYKPDKKKKKNKFSKFTGALKSKVDDAKLNSLANTLKSIGTEFATGGEGTSGGDIARMTVAELREEVVSLRKENAQLIEELEQDLNDSDFEDEEEPEEDLSSGGKLAPWKAVKRYWRKVKSINKKNVFVPNTLNPPKTEHRTWKWYHIMFLFVSMVIDIPTYMLGSSLIGLGLPWWALLLIIIIGNIVITVPMLIVAGPGYKYGIPFPVLLRSTFGIHGAKLAALLRAFFASGWFGIQCWIAGQSLHLILVALQPSLADNGINPNLGDYLGFWIFDDVRLLPFLLFLLFWAVNMAIVFKGLNFMRSLEIIASVYLVLVCSCLFIWSIVVIKGDIPRALNFLSNELLDNGGDNKKLNRVWAVWLAINAVLCRWSGVTVNITDYSRFTPRQYHHILGTLLGFPIISILLTCLGAFVTSAAYLYFGAVLWNPVDLVAQFTPLFAILGLVSFVIATLSTNISANIVSPSNDFSNLYSRKISTKRGGIITGVLGIILMPWKLIMNQDTFLQVWLLTCGTVIGTLTGIVLFDYVVIKRRILSVKGLYDASNHSEYWYKLGWNYRSWVSLIITLVVLLPGALGRMGAWDFEANGFSQFLDRIYIGGWILGIIIGAGLYGLIIGIEKILGRGGGRVEVIGDFGGDNDGKEMDDMPSSRKASDDKWGEGLEGLGGGDVHSRH
eukprot:TRINITY_DN2645_c0_g1_i1.p1 TRINITY_DN2645_c0_g1~~TRINITY_DN2645_c0_g1_i1.p1  ORF type:complete len:740 (-),score=173.43 TRINITY_DN2645_c0_g1_i1:67-2286(-)